MNNIQIIESPIGNIKICATSYGVTEVSLTAETKTNSSPSHTTEACAAKLKSYFEGDMILNDDLCSPVGTEFQQNVWRVLSTIPYGKTVTYTWVASQIGRPSAVRAVANAIGKNPIAIIIPCHRVIGSNGKLTGYAGGIENKAWLLQHEEKTAGIKTGQLQSVTKA